MHDCPMNLSVLRAFAGAEMIKHLRTFLMQANPTPVLIQKVFVVLLLILLCIPAQLSLAQETLADNNPPIEAQVAELQAKVAQIDERIATAAQTSTEDYAAQLGVSMDIMKARTDTLQDIRYVMERHVDDLEELDRLLQQRETLRQTTDKFQGLSEPPPYAISIVDALLAEADAKTLEYESALQDLTLAQEDVKRREGLLAASKSNFSLKLEELGRKPGTAVSPRNQWEVSMLQIQAELAEAGVTQSKAFAETRREKIALLEAESKLLGRKVAIADANAYFTQEEFEEKVAALKQKREHAEKEAKNALAAYELQKRRVAEAERALDKVRATADKSEEENSRLETTLEARRLVAENAFRRYEVLRDLSHSIEREQRLWELRRQVKDPERDVGLEELEARLKASLGETAKTRDILMSRLAGVRTRISSFAQQIEQWGNGVPGRDLVVEKLASSRELRDIYELGLTRSSELDRLVNRIQQEIDARKKIVSMGQRWTKVKERISGIWNYKITDVEDSPLTVRKICIALIVLVAGLAISRLMARALRRFAITRLKFDENAAAIVSKGFFYLLLLFVGYYTLSVIRVPLTVFTFVGGAMAIGVGFGAQNLINNFISGLILMIERPIRINDVIELDGQRGRITNIGARCSYMRTFAGVDILVPNSTFLEKNVVNWTLSDPKIRFSVAVGVAYGSPTREAARLLFKAAEEHGKVLRQPEPIVLFDDFGEHALIFEVFFWVEMTSYVDARIVQSDVRHRIDKFFREAGITIAFPQRDVHLDTGRPIEVRVLSPEEVRDSRADGTSANPE
jgi:potassium efflux system protein